MTIDDNIPMFDGNDSLGLADVTEAARFYPQPLAISEWIVEEGNELVQAAIDDDTPAQLDAIFDLLGLAIGMLSLYTREERKKGFAAYLESQKKRGRAQAFWYGVIRRALRHVNLACSSDDASWNLTGAYVNRLRQLSSGAKSTVFFPLICEHIPPSLQARPADKPMSALRRLLEQRGRRG